MPHPLGFRGNLFDMPQAFGATKLITPPVNLALSLVDAKKHLRVDLAEDDDLITDLIKAAIAQTEDLTSRKLITQTWQFFLDRFPFGRMIELPFAPVQSVTSIKSTDQDGAETTQDNTEYIVDVVTTRARIVLKEDFDWPDPDVDLQEANAVKIQFIVGFGDDDTDVPGNLRSAVKLLVGHLYENREAVSLRPGSSFQTLPMGYDALIAPFRLYARRM